MKRPTYRIEYDSATEEHLVVLEAGDQSTLMDAIPRQLAHQPTVETRNRKRMRPNPVASFELRVGQLRVYYDVTEGPDPLVTVRAIGTKQRERVRIGKEWVEL